MSAGELVLLGGAAPPPTLHDIAMQKVDDTASPVTWREHVTDEEYNALPAS